MKPELTDITYVKGKRWARIHCNDCAVTAAFAWPDLPEPSNHEVMIVLYDWQSDHDCARTVIPAW